MDDRLVYITQTYDYLPGPLPPGWQDIKPVWFDASNCWTGEVAAPQETGSFVIESEPWIPNVEGRIVDAVGVSLKNFFSGLGGVVVLGVLRDVEG